MRLSTLHAPVHYIRRFGRAILVLCGLAFFTAFLSSMHSRPASATAPGGSVTIANTPLPVTGNVNATVSGTVGISGTPSVAISGTPTVSLSGTPTVNLGSTTKPLPVTAAGDPSASGFTPVSGEAGGSFQNGGCSIQFTNPASAGQILVVENVTATAILSTGQKVSSMFILGLPTSSYFIPTYQADDGTFAYFGGSQTTRLYYPANNNFNVSVGGSNSASGVCNITFTGYVANVH